jgi:hypothetical protein
VYLLCCGAGCRPGFCSSVQRIECGTLFFFCGLVIPFLFVWFCVSVGGIISDVSFCVLVVACVLSCLLIRVIYSILMEMSVLEISLDIGVRHVVSPFI